MKEFKNKVAVVTGAASGIGRAIAERLATEEMKVVLADVEENALFSTEKELLERGAKVKGIRTDVTDQKDVQLLAQKTLEEFGAVHILCNNAGVFGDFAPIWKQNVEEWEWVLGVNLWGVIHGIRSFVPIMIDQKVECHIINTSSMAGLFSMPLVSLYHVSKHAVITLTESLYHELKMQKTKLKASVLCPGMVKTNFMESDRNKPSAHTTPDAEHDEMKKIWHDAYSNFIAGSMPPSEVADKMLEAIKEDKFYIFPSTGPLEIYRSQFEGLLNQQNPILNLPEGMMRSLHIS